MGLPPEKTDGSRTLKENTRMEFQDKVIMCEGCKKEFTHTIADQTQFAERGFRWEPKRCPDCRKARKEKNTTRRRGYTGPGGIGPVDGGGWGGRGGGGGGGYDRGERRGGGGFGGSRRREGEGGFGGGGGGYGGGGGGYGGSRPSFDAVCAACGTKTTVPFEPTEGRDVYCRECFQKRKAGGGAS
jgi:CxxC-x17-CxxC domain-containing protein